MTTDAHDRAEGLRKTLVERWEGGDPGWMLDWVGRRGRERKLRLFGVACCQRVWGNLPDERLRRCVETNEQYADGLVASAAVFAAHHAAEAALTALRRSGGAIGHVCAAEAVGHLGRGLYLAMSVPGLRLLIEQTAKSAGARARREVYERHCRAGTTDLAARHAEEESAFRGAEDQERRFQADLLRDLFGDLALGPSVPPAWRDEYGETMRPCLDPRLRQWNHGAVAHLSRAIYEERAFELLPVLADALEDAGCAEESIMEHLRWPGLHGRGCWALDVVLGKG